MRWRILAEMAVFETTYGNEKLASAYREEVRVTLDYIIEHITEGELQASFIVIC